MAKVSVSLDDDDGTDVAARVKDLAAALPSISRSKSLAMKNAPRVQFSFTNVPKPISEAFASEATRRGITKKELLYECLRAGGIEIPSAEEVDGRRR